MHLRHHILSTFQTYEGIYIIGRTYLKITKHVQRTFAFCDYSGVWRGGEPAHGEKVWGLMTPPKHHSVEVKPKYHISVPCFENVSYFLPCSEYLPHFQPASPVPSVVTCLSTRGAYSLRTLWFSVMALRVKLEEFWAGKDSSHLVYPHSFIERATEHQSEQGQSSREFRTEAELNSFLIHRLPLKLTFSLQLCTFQFNV